MAESKINPETGEVVLSDSERLLMAEIEALKAEIAERKAEKFKSESVTIDKLTFRVAPKGGVSVYGLGKFPVTLFESQWKRLLARAKDLQDFIEVHYKDLAHKS